MNEKEPPLGWQESLGGHATNPPNPRTSGEVLIVYERCPHCVKGVQASGVKCPECGGTGKSDEIREEITLSSDENRIKAQFEQWVKRNAKKAIAEAEREDGPDEAAALRSAYMADLGAGSYKWDGRHSRMARSDIYGICYLVFLMARRCHPDITEEHVERVVKDDFRQHQGATIAHSLAWALGNWSTPSSQESKTGKTAMTVGRNGETERAALAADGGTRAMRVPAAEKRMTKAEWAAETMAPPTLDS